MLPSPSASSQDSLRERLGRKLTKRKPDHRSSSLDMPDRLKDGDDAMEDVTAPRPGSKQYMNQSLFNMITAAGSTADFHTRFDEGSSESEGDADPVDPIPKPSKVQRPSKLAGVSEAAESSSSGSDSQKHKHRRASSKQLLLRSMQKLHLRPIREKSAKSDEDHMSSSQILAPRPKHKSASESLSGDAPLLRRMLKGEADMQASDQGDLATAKDGILVGKKRKQPTVTLADRLKDIFELEEPEEVISEYPCWFLQTVLLSGYMYLTQKHICYYAYLPKSSGSIEKSGYLGKRGQRNPRYRRYYLELKGDVLSYYEDPSKIYYPSGQIDLRYGISATIEPESKDKPKEESPYINLVTSKREYSFKADSPQSAREWVKHLQKVIFRTHNDGDSVKILLPINNIIDIEEAQFLDVADTVKIRVIDNDETYAIDEYYFSFFSFGKEALRVLKIMVEGNNLHQPSNDDSGLEEDQSRASQSSISRPSITIDRIFDAPSRTGTGPLRESVRATLTPAIATDNQGSRRSSFESRRSSMEIPRRSFEASRASSELSRNSGSVHRRGGRSKSPLSPKLQEAPSSPTSDSLDNETDDSIAFQSLDESNVSASQILNRSDVFKTPTSHIPRRSTSNESSIAKLHRASEDTARSAGRSRSSFDDRTGRRTDKSAKPLSRPKPGERQDSSSALQDIMRVGAYPLSRATGIAGMIRDQSKRMSSKIATESMGYLEKVSGMWQGGVKHYGPVDGMPPDDDDMEGDDEMETEHHAARFREHFALPESEHLVATYFAYFYRVLPLYGKIYISNKHFCYRSLLPGTRTKLVLPLKDIERAAKEKGYRPGYCGLVITIRGHEEIFFDFRQSDARDDCTVLLILSIESSKETKPLIADAEMHNANMAKAEYEALQEARKDGKQERDVMPKIDESDPDCPPVLFDDPRASILNFKPSEPLRITCLTIGSRGDVQPYIALAKGLMAEGHKVRIATHIEFEPWIRKHGIDFAPVSGDPGELMRICIEYGMFTYGFLREAHSKFRGWLDELLISAWEACQDTDLLIESPSAMAGIHIAEALQIPYFRAFTMPWTRTRAYPHAFAVPENKRGGPYNYFTYIIVEGVFWKGIAGAINKWRKRDLKLGATSLDKMQPNKVPFLYNFSPSVVAPPLDYSDWIRITGYWFLDEGPGYVPPEDIVAFIKKARIDGKKIVYIGFGSILVEDPAAMTKTVVDAVMKADVRCILAKGWSNRVAGNAPTKAEPTPVEIPLPPEIFQVQSVPHDWLFPQMDAVAHHGGSGTTGASIRSGVPTIAKPFFGDQFFFGARLEDLGVGICLKKLNSTVFARALWEATHSERMIARAKVLGEQVRSENGVGNAINCIYRDLEYARSLIKRHDRREDLAEDIEEHWTFVDAESGSEVSRSMVSTDFDTMQHSAQGMRMETRG